MLANHAVPPPKSPVESDRGIEIVIVYKMVRGIASILAALVLGAFVAAGQGRRFSEFAVELRHHLTGAFSVRLAEIVVRASAPRYVVAVTAALAFDGCLSFFEGWALRRRYRWAPWVVVVATGSLLPFEIAALLRQVHVGRFLLLAINSAIVVYLIRRVLREQR
jgi:uncharacterized membrane protein (DUF2068 family)